MTEVRSNSGFTLVELMVTVAIVAILLKLIGWGFAGATAYEDVRTAARRLETIIQEAKALAYEKGVVQTVVFFKDGSGCELFADNNTNGKREAGEPVIRQVKFTSRVVIDMEKTTLLQNDDDQPFLSIGSDGRLVIPPGKESAEGAVRLTGQGNNQATVSINSLGWVHVHVD